MAYGREEAAELIIKAGLELVEKGLIARTWGNISARISDTEFMITPSGMAYEDLTPDKLVVCKIADCSYHGDIKPSSEKGVHGESYRLREDVNFVIHTHQLYVTAVGTLGKSIYPDSKEERALFGEEVPSAKYAISSTVKLKKRVSQCIAAHKQSKAFFMRYHGVLCLGTDYANAFAISEALESKCEKIILEDGDIDASAIIGKKTEFLQENAMEELQKKTKYTCISVDVSPAVVEMAKTGGKVYPMIDDMAQIAGVSFPVLSAEDKNFTEQAAKVLEKRNCVFVKGKGAIVASNSISETDAIHLVLQKNCLAACYGKKHGVTKHLGLLDASLQRRTYVEKYSKLK